MIESEVVLLLLHFKILIQGHLFTRFVQKMTRPVKNYKSINVKVEEFGVGFGFPMWVLLTVLFEYHVHKVFYVGDVTFQLYVQRCVGEESRGRRQLLRREKKSLEESIVVAVADLVQPLLLVMQHHRCSLLVA